MTRYAVTYSNRRRVYTIIDREACINLKGAEPSNVHIFSEEEMSDILEGLLKIKDGLK